MVERLLPFIGVTFFFGVTFGLVAVTAGVSLWMAVGMSAVIFGGAAQFAALGIAMSGGSTSSALMAAILLNARFGIMGLSLSRSLGFSFGARFFAAFLVSDPSFALSLAGFDSVPPERVYWIAGVSTYAAWVGGTIIGGILGHNFPDPYVLGLDAALPALLVAVFAKEFRSKAGSRAAISGAVIACALIPLSAPGVPVVLGSLGAFVPRLCERRCAKVADCASKEDSQ